MGSQYTTRNYAPFDLIHFTVRGHRRRRIFHDQADHAEFLECIRDRLDAIPIADRPTLHAYGQMPNHQHVLLRNGQDPDATSRIMRGASASYARSYNWRHALSGPVFQRPFRGRIVRGADHIMNTFAYIHLNPDASLRIENSSHGFYAGLRNDPHIDPTLAWEVFGGRDGYFAYFTDSARIRAARRAARFRLET